MIHYIIVFILLIFSLKIVSKYTTPINELIDKSYPNIDDNVSILLDRIEWTNHYQGRIKYIFRFIIYSFIITLITNIIIFEKLKDGKLFLQLMISICIILLVLNSFFNHHSDKFGASSIDESINLIRKKINKKRGNFSKLSRRTLPFTGKDKCFTFFYKY
jgi:hypothetical protein